MTSTQTRRANEVGQSLSPLHPCTLTPSDRDMMPNNTAKWPIARQQKKKQTVYLHQQHQGPKQVLQPIPVLSHKEYVWIYQLLKPSPTKLVFSKDTNFIKSQSYLRASLLTSTTPSNPEPKSVESLLTNGCNGCNGCNRTEAGTTKAWLSTLQTWLVKGKVKKSRGWNSKWPRSAPGPLLPSKKCVSNQLSSVDIKNQEKSSKWITNVSKSDKILSEAPIRSFVAGITWMLHSMASLSYLKASQTQLLGLPYCRSGSRPRNPIIPIPQVAEGICSQVMEEFSCENWRKMPENQKNASFRHLEWRMLQMPCCLQPSSEEKMRKTSHKYKPFFDPSIAFGEALANAGSRKGRYCWKCCNDQSVSGFGSSLPRVPKLSSNENLAPFGTNQLRGQLLHPRWIWRDIRSGHQEKNNKKPGKKKAARPGQPHFPLFDVESVLPEANLEALEFVSNEPMLVVNGISGCQLIEPWPGNICLRLLQKEKGERKVGKKLHIDMSLKRTFREKGIDLGNSGWCTLLKENKMKLPRPHAEMHWWISWGSPTFFCAIPADSLWSHCHMHYYVVTTSIVKAEGPEFHTGMRWQHPLSLRQADLKWWRWDFTKNPFHSAGPLLIHQIRILLKLKYFACARGPSTTSARLESDTQTSWRHR